MAQTTTNYGLYKPESTDSYNHLIYDNPNMDTIDAAMKANSDAAITSASCIKSGTTHTITRTNPDAPVLRFTATGDWNGGDTMIVDGVTVTPYLANGDALISKAFLINTEVLMAVSGTRATVYTNANIASNIEYSAGVTVADAIASAATAAGTEYSAGVSVADKFTAMETWTAVNPGGSNVNELINLVGLNYKDYYVVITATYGDNTIMCTEALYPGVSILSGITRHNLGSAPGLSNAGVQFEYVVSAANIQLVSAYINGNNVSGSAKIYVVARN